MSGEPPYQPDDVVRITTDQQLRAVNNRMRHRMLALLREGPATISQVAARLGVLKGSASYHMRLLERAGLIRVVQTRKVRGVTERYYAHAARRIMLPMPDQPTTLLRQTLADLDEAPTDPSHVQIQHARISPQRFVEFTARLGALLDDLAAGTEPDQPTATLAVVFFRPREPDPGPDTVGHEPRSTR